MPVYLCQPGAASASKEPWRHGVQVYERPFPLYDESCPPPPAAAAGDAGGPEQIVEVCPLPAEKEAALRRHLAHLASPAASRGSRAIVFCRVSAGGQVARGLPAATVLHGGQAALERQAAWDAFREGSVAVLVVEDDVEESLRELLRSSPDPPVIHTVFNYDLDIDIAAYLARLAIARCRVVSFFDPVSGRRERERTEARGRGVSAEELVEALLRDGQAVPGELRGLAEAAAPLGDPPAEGGAARGRTLRALPSRDDSHSRSPLPRRREDAAAAAGEGNVARRGNVAAEDRPRPVRRVRHAEVVLVDQCLVAFGRTWLRLRWPGERGGCGGYVALGLAPEEEEGEGGAGPRDGVRPGDSLEMDFREAQESEEEEGSRTKDDRTAGGEGELPLCQEVSAPSSAPRCRETNLPYPTSEAMKLLLEYDDGLSDGVCMSVEEQNQGVEELLRAANNGEPVFCRICREGLHDVHYDQETTSQPQPATAEGEEATGNRAVGVADSGMTRGDALSSSASSIAQQQSEGNAGTDALRQSSHADFSPLVLHHPTAENPLLAPCKCTGTMAFVHYLCVEQWRCRSRHPDAREGLNCETCGAEYALPPPPSRPAPQRDRLGVPAPGGGGVLMAEEDWLDAMPPHVLAALRRPHPAWQLGAAVVRRRWLRPAVPVLVSPLVALYCRARRALKKRGVSRRRWACSLCRRRARWKCVRCLRSYYCSRQCQNVSWHIVHKHVCYKPVRFWWSVVVYSAGIVMAVPNFIEKFPIYDAMATLLPVNFIALGIVVGGIASLLKRAVGLDIRGRILETIVVLQTLLLTAVSSGLVREYFGETSQCLGAFSPITLSLPFSINTMEGSNLGGLVSQDPGEDPVHQGPGEDFTQPGPIEGPFQQGLSEDLVSHGPFYPPFLNKILLDIPLKHIQLWYIKWDMVLSKLGPLSRHVLCTPGPDGSTDFAVAGCSPPTQTISPRFYLNRNSGRQCSGDIMLVMGVWFMALCVLAMGNTYRQIRGERRAAGLAAANRGRRRPHQD